MVEILCKNYKFQKHIEILSHHVEHYEINLLWLYKQVLHAQYHTDLWEIQKMEHISQASLSNNIQLNYSLVTVCCALLGGFQVKLLFYFKYCNFLKNIYNGLFLRVSISLLKNSIFSFISRTFIFTSRNMFIVVMIKSLTSNFNIWVISGLA